MSTNKSYCSWAKMNEASTMDFYIYRYHFLRTENQTTVIRIIVSVIVYISHLYIWVFILSYKVYLLFVTVSISYIGTIAHYTLTRTHGIHHHRDCIFESFSHFYIIGSAPAVPLEY